jgi:hypothetical protein
MGIRKPVRCREGAGDTWTKRACRPGGNSWGRRAVRGCHVA